ncbi:MAG TPA: IS110 family transposase [Actinomycetota bacterium]|nr:IS110 family transposase [Actinomycetota bacterium]
MDFHTRTTTLAIFDPYAENPYERMAVKTIRGSLKTVLDSLKTIKGPYEICYEASTGYGVVHDTLTRCADRVVVAHPGKLKRSKEKNDKNDAQTLAKLLFADIVPTVHVPRTDIRGWRQLINHRNRLVTERTAVKNALRALLRGLAIDTPRNLWTKTSLAWLQALEFDSSSDALMRDTHLGHLAYIHDAIRRVEVELDAIAAKHPGVALLQTIPGVGPRTAEAIVAWVDDPRRFRSSKSIGNYLGLVPCQDASADRNRLGRITKAGPPVIRRLLNQAAWQAIRLSPEVRAFRDRIQRDDPKRKNPALVATMHYLARVMVAMLLHGTAWAPRTA